MIYGSAIKNYSQAKDIDLIILLKKNEIKEINEIIQKKEEILPKRIHALKLTLEDLSKNIKKKDKVVIDIIKNAIILYGHGEYVKTMENTGEL